MPDVIFENPGGSSGGTGSSTPSSTSSALSIASVTPNIVSRAGGDQVVITGVFPQGVAIAPLLLVQEHAGQYVPYSGVRGQGSTLYSLNGTSLSFFMPAIPDTTALTLALVLSASGYTAAQFVSALSLRAPFFYSQVYALRSVLPPRYAAGPRSFDNEDPIS